MSSGLAAATARRGCGQQPCIVPWRTILNCDQLTFYFDACTRFYGSVFISGWAHGPVKPDFAQPVVTGASIAGLSWRVKPELAGLGNIGAIAAGFELQILTDCPETLRIAFRLGNYEDSLWSPDSIVARMIEQQPSHRAWEKFQDLIRDEGVRTMLDIGGRARSGIFRAGLFPDLDVDVLDIIAAEGVTFVGDAHRLSSLVGAKKYDAVMSNSVFEHLVMPWKVAVEMNRVLKTGGVGFVMSHQTVGMHDLPWDFFRFSDSAWSGLFNKATGFEIIQTDLSNMNFILPCRWEDRGFRFEDARGFEISQVLVRKVSDCQLDWPLSAADVLTNFYPE
jgi:hypothetical protein